MSVEFYTTEQDFARKFIALVKTTYPDLPIVEINQNTTQPVNILNGEKLMTFDIELVRKTGTDYVVGSFEGLDENFVYAGDREVQVMIEVFSPIALSELTKLRDIWETLEYQQTQLELGIMEKRQNTSPRKSTRKQSKEKFVTSARYVTQFHMGIFYTSEGNIIGDITSAVVTTGIIK